MALRAEVATGPGGKDLVVVAGREALAAPGRLSLPEPEPAPGLILADGSINWGCPCLGGMATGPCGQQFLTIFKKPMQEVRATDEHVCVDVWMWMKKAVWQDRTKWKSIMFAYSSGLQTDADPKGSDCYEKFSVMQECMAQYPELYGKDDEDEGEEQEAAEAALASASLTAAHSNAAE